MLYEFTCIADAVAHFYDCGYETLETHSGYRIMINPVTREQIEIIKSGFLTVHVYILERKAA